VDFDALRQLSALDHDAALRKTAEPLESAGLTFPNAKRIAGNDFGARIGPWRSFKEFSNR